jgi:hypothetical protein
MAIGKKTGGRNFRPGQTGNPRGRPRIPDDIKAMRSLNRFELERILNYVFFAPGGMPEITRLTKAEDIHPGIVAAAKQMENATKGNIWSYNLFLERLVGRVREAEPRDVTPALAIAPAAKKSFSEFVTAAGYPPPFPKQIEMVDFLLTLKDPRLLLGARGYGKTDYLTIMGVAYDIYMDPDHTWMIITKEKKRSSAIIAEIATALTANGVELEKSNSNCIRLKGHQGKDHSVDARSIKSGLRGPHPYGIVMDDPVTEEDVSEATRALVERKYNEAFKLTSNIMILGQPAHQHDLYAKLRPLLKKMEIPHGSIPELDHDLEAQRLAGVDEASIQASYHLKIVSEGVSPFGKVKYIDKYPNGDSVAFIDPSHEGGDYTALSIFKMHMQGIVVQGHVYKKAWNHCLDEMVPHLVKRGVKKLCFETNALGDQPLLMLRELLKTYGIGVTGLRSNTNKHSRIMAAGAYAHLIHLSKESDRVYTEQVVKYEYKAKFDDAPDSLASGLGWIGLIRGKT